MSSYSQQETLPGDYMRNREKENLLYNPQLQTKLNTGIYKDIAPDKIV